MGDICRFDSGDWADTLIAPAAFYAAFPYYFEGTDTEWFKEKVKERAFVYYCGCSYSLAKFCMRCGKELNYMEWVRDLWMNFGDVPMDPETECIEEQWLTFETGTHREDIWHWFEETFQVSVAKDLMRL